MGDVEDRVGTREDAAPLATRPPWHGFAYLAGAIVSEVSASLSLKGALSSPGLYVIVVAGFLAAFAFLARSLRAGLSVGVAYGIWGACGVAATALLSRLVFSEPLTPLMGLGIALVMAGVLCIEFGSHEGEAAHAAADGTGDAARDGEVR